MFSYQEVYPLTIISDRYDGAYSDGAFTAWNLYYNNVPEEIDAGDVECREFWESDHGYIVGKGNTPNEAAEDLIKKVQAIEEALAKLEEIPLPPFAQEAKERFEKEWAIKHGGDDYHSQIVEETFQHLLDNY